MVYLTISKSKLVQIALFMVCCAMLTFSCKKKLDNKTEENPDDGGTQTETKAAKLKLSIVTPSASYDNGNTIQFQAELTGDTTLTENLPIQVQARFASPILHNGTTVLTDAYLALGLSESTNTTPIIITILAGQKSATSATYTLSNTGLSQSNVAYTDINLTCMNENISYEQKNTSFVLTLDAPLGAALEDERYVYSNPVLEFISANRAKKAIATQAVDASGTAIEGKTVDINGDGVLDDKDFKAWYDYDIAARKDHATAIGTSGSAWRNAKPINWTINKGANVPTMHPNATLAARGWEFQTSYEFHKVCVTNSIQSVLNYCGLNATESPVGSFGALVNGSRYPLGMADQNTASTQKNAAVDNYRFASVTDEGYLKMWALQNNGSDVNYSSASVGGGATKGGQSAFYFGKIGGTSSFQNTTLGGPGYRIEFRARMTNAEGANIAFWLQGNSSYGTTIYSVIGGGGSLWPRNGEIDVLETSKITSKTAHQTLHYTATDNGNSNTVASSVNFSNWNIYWMEFYKDSILVGVNGATTKKFEAPTLGTLGTKESQLLWPFNWDNNPTGFQVLLTMGYEAYSSGSMASGLTQTDAAAATISTTNIPVVWIDWIRCYTNTNGQYYPKTNATVAPSDQKVAQYTNTSSGVTYFTSPVYPQGYTY